MMFIQSEEMLYFIGTEALVFQPFYNSDIHEHGLWAGEGILYC